MTFCWCWCKVYDPDMTRPSVLMVLQVFLHSRRVPTWGGLTFQEASVIHSLGVSTLRIHGGLSQFNELWVFIPQCKATHLTQVPTAACTGCQQHSC